MKTERITRIIDLKELYNYYEPLKVEGFCRSCPNYGRIWSCPPHEFDPCSYLEPYKFVMIIGEKIFLQEDISKEELNQHFQSARRVFGNFLISLAEKEENLEVLIAGNCFLCNVCQREANLSCIYQERLKYSLESIGFLVSGITRDILDIELEWPSADKNPEFLLMVGAVMAAERSGLDNIAIKND